MRGLLPEITRDQYVRLTYSSPASDRLPTIVGAAHRKDRTIQPSALQRSVACSALKSRLPVSISLRAPVSCLPAPPYAGGHRTTGKDWQDYQTTTTDSNCGACCAAFAHRSHCRCAPLPCRGLQATANRSKQGRCVTVRTTVQGCKPAASLLRTRNLPQSAGQIWGFFGKSLVQPISCAIIARAHETCALVRHPPVRHVCFAPLANAHARRTLSARCDHDPRRTNRPR